MHTIKYEDSQNWIRKCEKKFFFPIMDNSLFDVAFADRHINQIIFF